jgi:hypothetical protein
VGAAAGVAALLGLPAPLTTGLLGAAVVLILGRALRTAVCERRAGIDAPDSTAALLMIARGNVVAAGLMSALVPASAARGAPVLPLRRHDRRADRSGSCIGWAHRGAARVRH